MEDVIISVLIFFDQSVELTDTHMVSIRGPAQSKIVLFTYSLEVIKVSKGAKIRNRYNQVPCLTQDTNGKLTKSQFDTTNESQEVSPFREGDQKAHINRRSQRHSKYKTEKT